MLWGKKKSMSIRIELWNPSDLSDKEERFIGSSFHHGLVLMSDR